MCGSRKVSASVLFISVFLFISWQHPSFAIPVEEDCCYGFTRLRSGGDVEVDPFLENATLGDDGAVLSYLFSFYNPGPGQYSIDLDIRNDLSDIPYPQYSPPFAFLDTFYASVMFRDEQDGDDCDTCYEWQPLFDMDASGFFNNYGTLSSSPLGDEWMHFTMSFESSRPYIITAFELVDWNGINDDSEIALANICITRVPLPTTVLLLASGLACITALGRRRKNPIRN